MSSASFNFLLNACNANLASNLAFPCVSWSLFLTVFSKDLCLVFKEATVL